MTLGIFARRYVGSAGPTPISPLTNEPVLECPADLTVNANGSGQATVPGLRSQAVITGGCAPCAAITVTQSPAPGTVVSCGGHPITLTLNDTAGHTASCTTTFNVINPANSVNVVLKVVDQHGQEIPGSRIDVLSQTVNTGDSLLLPEGTQFFLVMPGLRGAVGNTTELFRNDERVVTCTTTELLFEWITSTFSVRIQDQHGADIPASKYQAAGPSTPTVAGDPVTLPITDESVYPTMAGGYKDGYYVSLIPGLRGSPGSTTELYRYAEGPLELSAAPAEFVFEWITSIYTVRLTDQHGVDIPASSYNTAGPSGYINAGDPVTLPITDESVYPALQGGYKSGYYVSLFPGLDGRSGSSTELYRYAEGPLELSAVPAEFVFEWITSPITIRLKDQHGVDIPGSRFSVTTSSHILNAGDSITLPITDESVYPSMAGFYKDGYFTAIAPGINGNPGSGNFLYRYENNLELGTEPAAFDFEWIQHQCALEVRNAANAPVPGSDLVLPPLFPDYAPGQAVTFPVNDAATYPTIGGYYASSSLGYWITVKPGDIAPTSSEIYFTVRASGEFSPASFIVGGNTYKLACGGCAQDNTPPTIACPPNVTVAFNALPAPVTTATDNCDPNPTVTFVDSATGTCPMIVTRTCTVTDASGNFSTCQQIITVNNLFASDAIIWHRPLAREGKKHDRNPSANSTLKYRFKHGSTIPIKIHARGCGDTDVTCNANVIGKVDVFGDTDCDGDADGNALPIDYNGVGEAGGIMDKIGCGNQDHHDDDCDEDDHDGNGHNHGRMKYNLDTKKLPTTIKCYILQVTVTDTSTGESRSETVLLQAK